MHEAQVPVVYRGTKAYTIMVSADYYNNDRQIVRDSNYSTSVCRLYMPPLKQQTAAVLNFLQENHGLFDSCTGFKLENLGNEHYNGGHMANQFQEGIHAEEKGKRLNFSACA